jgi:hypothetical protein
MTPMPITRSRQPTVVQLCGSSNVSQPSVWAMGCARCQLADGLKLG